MVLVPSLMLSLMAILTGSEASTTEYPAPPLRMPEPISYVELIAPPADPTADPAADIDMMSGIEAPRSFPVTPMADPSTPEGKLQIYMRELSKGFDARIRSVIPKISGCTATARAMRAAIWRLASPWPCDLAISMQRMPSP